MTAAQPLDHVLRHNTWATATLLEFCANLDAATLEMSAGGTYGTLYGTLQHLVGAEQWYLQLLTGDLLGRRRIRRTDRHPLPELATIASLTGARVLEVVGTDDVEWFLESGKLAAANIHLPIIFITGYGDIPMSVRAMKGGAIEFLTKPFRDQDLLDAIQLGIARDRARLEDEKAATGLRARFETLTPREREVMALVAAGRLNKQIAYEIGVSEITVKVHRGQVMRKMQAASLPDLARMADRLNLTGEKSQSC